jgi:hypothetical protein
MPNLERPTLALPGMMFLPISLVAHRLSHSIRFLLHSRRTILPIHPSDNHRDTLLTGAVPLESVA